MKRGNMKVDTFYILPDGITFITPDGLGGWWYDSLEEAISYNGNYPAYAIDGVDEWE